MSGFEIAGIVLGAFSVLADGVKDAHGPYQKLKRWWSFGIAFEDFLLRLDTERVAFLQNLDNLLSSTDIPDDHKALLQEDPHCQLWNDPRVQAELRHRITDRYFDWYITVLSDIREALREINGFLPVGKVHQIDSRGLEDIRFRARTSFSSRKDRLLERIQYRNEDISKFLQRESMQLQHQMPRRASSIRSLTSSRTFLQTQKRSRELHAAFQSVWNCKCSNRHSCGITSSFDLDKTRPASQVSLLISNGLDHHVLRIEELDCDDVDKNSATYSTTTTTTTIVQDIPDLRQHVAIKNKTRKIKKPKGALKLFVKSTVSFLNNLGPGDPTATSSQTKPKLRFASSVTPPMIPLPSTGSQLTDLCKSLAISGVPTTSLLGFLAAQSAERKFLLHLDEALAQQEQKQPTQHSRPKSGIKDLASFLSTTPRRSTRIRVGLGLVITLLSLDSSFWIPSELDKTLVLVINQPYGDRHPAPYLCQHDMHNPSQASSAAERTRLCLLSLGILLLELLFGQTVEQQPEWNTFKGPDGKPSRYTSMCTAIEWQKKVELDVGDGISDAIQKCLYCDFGVERDLSNPRFVQAVLDGVVEPLRDFLSWWNTKVSIPP